MNTAMNAKAAQLAKLRELRRLIKRGPVSVTGAKGGKLPLPAQAARLLDEILKNLAEGRSVSVVPELRVLTTQQAADVLSVSRPFLVRLLEEGKLPFHMAGSHRRLYAMDVLAYQSRRDKQRHASIVRMARMEKKEGTYDKVILPDAAEEQ